MKLEFFKGRYNVKKVINSTEPIKDECLKCWALRFCDVCAKIANGKDDNSRSLLKKHCNLLRESIKNGILGILAMREVRDDHSNRFSI